MPGAGWDDGPQHPAAPRPVPPRPPQPPRPWTAPPPASGGLGAGTVVAVVAGSLVAILLVAAILGLSVSPSGRHGAITAGSAPAPTPAPAPGPSPTSVAAPTPGPAAGAGTYLQAVASSPYPVTGPAAVVLALGRSACVLLVRGDDPVAAWFEVYTGEAGRLSSLQAAHVVAAAGGRLCASGGRPAAAVAFAAQVGRFGSLLTLAGVTEPGAVDSAGSEAVGVCRAFDRGAPPSVIFDRLVADIRGRSLDLSAAKVGEVATIGVRSFCAGDLHPWLAFIHADAHA